MKKESKVHEEAFKEVMLEQDKDNGEYIKLLTFNTEIKNKLVILEDKLNIVLKETEDIKQIHIKEEVLENDSVLKTKMEPEGLFKEDANYPNYNEAAIKIEKMTEENKSIEEMASALSMGKGEVLLLKRLLTK